MASKFKFNPIDYGHRKLLTRAIRDFTSRSGNTVSGSTSGSGKSLVKELEQQGAIVSRSQIDRIKKATDPANPKDDYPNKDAAHVASYLQDAGFYPPGLDPEQVLSTLPIFFDGFGDTAANRLEQITGEYTCYQYSNVEPDYIVASELTIGDPTELRFAPVREEVRIRHHGKKTLVYEGIAFSDRNEVVYMVLRERSLRHPRFYLFNDSDENGDEAETLFGMILAAAREHRSHLSPVCLYRGDEAPPPKRVHKDDLSPLPELVRKYLARPMAPGYSNGAPPKSSRQK